MDITLKQTEAKHSPTCFFFFFNNTATQMTRAGCLWVCLSALFFSCRCSIHLYILLMVVGESELCGSEVTHEVNILECWDRIAVIYGGLYGIAKRLAWLINEGLLWSFSKQMGGKSAFQKGLDTKVQVCMYVQIIAHAYIFQLCNCYGDEWYETCRNISVVLHW